jgi:hypothetical protein
VEDNNTPLTPVNLADLSAAGEQRARDTKARILEIAEQVDPRGLLATLTTLHLMHPEGQAPDVDEMARWQVKLEYLTWLLGTVPIPSAVRSRIVDATVLEPLESALEEYVGAMTAVVAFSATGDDPLIQSIQQSVRIDALHVRGEGSPELIQYLARGLYGQHDGWFAANLGFTIEQAFIFARAMFSLNADKFHFARKEAKAVSAAFYQRFQAILAKSRSSWNADETAFVNETLSHGLSKAAELAGGAHLFGNIGQTRGFTAAELLARLAPTEHPACEAFLGFMSTEFGSLPSPATLLALNPLVCTPLLRDKDAFFQFVPPLLWDAVLNGPHYRLMADTDYEPTYSTARGEWLEQQVIGALSRVWPRAQVGWSLEYGPKKARKQLDGLVLFDRKLLLIECKSKTLTLSARQGNAEALRTDIQKAIGDSFVQAKRARDFVQQSVTPVRFDARDGSCIEVDRAQVDEVFLVSAFGRGALSILAANIADVGAATGLFAQGDYPWALSLVDVLGVCRTMEYEAQLVDYLRRRISVVKSGRFNVHDEWDLLELYFIGGLDVSDPEFAKFDRVGFTSSSDEILERLVLTPTMAVPKELRRKIPDRVRSVLSALQLSEWEYRTEAAAFILGWSDRQLHDFEQIWTKLERQTSADGRQHDATAHMSQLEGGFTLVCIPSADPDQLERLAPFFVTRKYRAKASKWLGLCAIANSQDMPLVWFDNAPWTADAAIEDALKSATPSNETNHQPPKE